MRIHRLELYRYLPFTFNDVELLTLDLPSDIQNLIGTNGSGKTALLREANPQPATRTDFGEQGYKRIFLNHEGSDYALVSDFSNTSAPHSFCKDGVELNSSGTTAVQNELVTTHLGYTPQVHAICYGRQKLSAMQVGLRKTFLLMAHPSQLRLVLDKHKSVTTKLRAARDNLAMLQERRAALVQQLLAPEAKAALLAENTQHTEDLTAIVDAISRLTQHQHHLRTRLAQYPRQYAVRSRAQVLADRVHYPAYQVIPRDVPYEQCRQTTLTEVAGLEARQTAAAHTLRTLITEIDKYTQYIQQDDAAGALESIEASIETLNVDIATLQSRARTNTPFDRFVLDQLPEHISQLTDLVGFFIGYTEPIPTMREVKQLEQKLEHNRRRLREEQANVVILQRQMTDIENNLHAHVIEDIPAGCQGCVLFRRYHATIAKIQIAYAPVDQALTTGRRRLQQLTALVEGRSARLALYHQAVPQLQRLSDYLSEHRFLLQPLQNIELIDVVRKNPTLILLRLEDHYRQSQEHYLLQRKKEERDKHIANHEKLKSPTTLGRQFLETAVREKQQTLATLRAEYAHQEATLQQRRQFLLLLDRYTHDLQQLQHEHTLLAQQEAYETLGFEQTICEHYQTQLKQAKLATVSRLAEIERVVREQQALEARYHHEVLANITSIELQERAHTTIEAALSPIHGLPHRYMVQFINDLIVDANIFISKVFSYPLEFIPFEEMDELSYKFKLRVGDVIIPDIALGSDAQKDMADLAFNLALIIQLKQTQYPLYLDEIDKALDAYHKQQLLHFLKAIVDDHLVSQLFMINHNVAVYGGMQNADTIVLSDKNILLPTSYNTHVTLQKY